VGGTLAAIIEPTTPLLTIGGSLEPRRMTLDEIHRVVKTTLFSRTMTDEKRSPVREKRRFPTTVVDSGALYTIPQLKHPQ
jgi:hypothetical protein